MHMTLKHKKQIHIVTVYIPQAERPEIEKVRVYTALDKRINEIKKKGIVIVMGDLNARIQKCTNAREKKCIGQWTFEPETN